MSDNAFYGRKIQLIERAQRCHDWWKNAGKLRHKSGFLRDAWGTELAIGTMKQLGIVKPSFVILSVYPLLIRSATNYHDFNVTSQSDIDGRHRFSGLVCFASSPKT